MDFAGVLIGNPWRYRGKRIDKETGLLYFGYRYYDPKVGRWMSPDPLGNVDGPNLYAYVHNNPMQYVDHFGLSSTIDENCRCTKHGHPGWYNAPHGCVCICGKDESLGDYRSGSNIANAITGISHGVVDFVVGSIHDLQTMMVHIGSGDMELTLQERVLMLEAVERSQANQMRAVETWMIDALSIDESNDVYQSFRSKTTTGLAIGSLVAGGYGAVKGIININKLVKLPGQDCKNLRKLLGSGIKLNRFHQATRNLSETGQNNIRILRGWAKSKGWKKQPNFLGAPEKWGIYQNNTFQWRLVIKPEGSTRPGLGSGSSVPRFDARFLTDKAGQSYINPFTGETGNWQIGTHLPLDFNY